MNRLLVLTNGAGEDAIAARVLAELPQEIREQVLCCPLVGGGHALSRFRLCGPRVHPPSEGLFRESWRLAAQDLARGVIGGHLRQLAFLRTLSPRVRLTVAVGDLFPVLWALLSGSRETLFIGTAKSVHHHRYSLFERFLLRRFVALSVVRDDATAASLRESGVPARWLGNAMMDEVQPAGVPLPFSTGGPVIALFPGSRSQAPRVLSYQLQVLRLIWQAVPEVQAGVALAPGTECGTLVEPSLAEGWRFVEGEGPTHLGTLRRDGRGVHLLAGVLGDLLAASQVALGQAGTANEQAAGAGVPVVAYDPRGADRLRWYRKRQKGLLGDAVCVVPRDQTLIAAEILRLLTDEVERQRRASVGRERMGPSGGSVRMASAISEVWFRS